jgi:tetratricopeptide (TPR) repeat protein
MRILACIFTLSAFPLAAVPIEAPHHPDASLQHEMEKIERALLVSNFSEAQSLWDTSCLAVETDTADSRSAACEHQAGAIAESHENYPAAAVHYAKSLNTWKALGGASVPDQIVTSMSLGDTYRRLHRQDDALKVFSSALRLSETLPQNNSQLHAAMLSRLGSFLDEMEQRQRAQPMLEQAIVLLEPLGDAAKAELAIAHDSLGMLKLRAGNYSAGESDLRQAVALGSAALGEDNPEIASYMTNLALALLLEGKFVQSETLLKRACSVIESRLGTESMRLVTTYAVLGSLEQRTGKFGLAEDYTQRALAILVHRLPPGSQEIVLTQVSLAAIYLREHKVDDAEKILPSAVEAERGFYRDGRVLADGVRGLATLRSDQRRWLEAQSLYREALGLYERDLGVEHPDIAPVLLEYADVLKHCGASKSEVKSVVSRARLLESRSSSRPV